MNLNNISPEELKNALNKLKGSVAADRLSDIEKTIKNASAAEISKKIKSLTVEDFEMSIKENPQLLSTLKNNPGLMEKLNSILKNK